MWCIRGALGKARKVLINARECTKGALECALNEARNKGKEDLTKAKVAAARQSLLKALLNPVKRHMARSSGIQHARRVILFRGSFAWDTVLLVLGYSRHMWTIYGVLIHV